MNLKEEIRSLSEGAISSVYSKSTSYSDAVKMVKNGTKIKDVPGFYSLTQVEQEQLLNVAKKVSLSSAPSTEKAPEEKKETTAVKEVKGNKELDTDEASARSNKNFFGTVSAKKGEEIVKEGFLTSKTEKGKTAYYFVSSKTNKAKKIMYDKEAGKIFIPVMKDGEEKRVTRKMPEFLARVL